MSVEVSQEQDYRKSVKSHAQYKFSRVIAQQGQGSTTNGWISISGGNEAVFEIPQVPINLSQSVLQLTLTPGASAAVDSFYNWVFMDTLSFLSGIQLYTRSGVMICDISNNLQYYLKVAWKSDVKLSEYENFDLHSNASGSGRMLRKSNGAATGTSPNCTKRPVSFNITSTTSEKVPYLENQYIQAGAGITDTTPVINVALPLSMIKNTIFEMDKTLYFNEVVLCRLIFGQASKFLFNGTSSSVPLTDAATATAAASVSNLNLYIAMERNPELGNVLRSEIQKGSFSIPIPCVNIFKQGAITGTSQSTTVRLNRAHGRRLLKIYHSMFGGSSNTTLEDKNFAYCNAVGANATYNLNEMTSYHTALQNSRLQDWEITLLTFDDWLIQQKRLEGSLVLNSDILRYNFFHLDDFTGSEKSIDKEYLEKNQMVGVPLDIEQRYDWFSTHATAAAAKQLNHYDFVITQKLLQITPQGIMCD